MIKAALVTPNLTLGGAERWLVDLVKHSDPARVKWTGVAISGYGGADENLVTELAQHTRVYANKPPNRPDHAKPFFWDAVHEITSPDFRETVSKAVRGAQVVLTWGQTTMTYWFRGLKIPRVLCSHTTLAEDPKKGIEGITHLTAVSEAAMRFFAGRDGYDRLPKTVIYNGTDKNRIKVTVSRNEMRDSWGVPRDAFVVGYLGRQCEEKNPDASANAVMDMGGNTHAVYFGCGPSGKGPNPELLTYCDKVIPCRNHFFAPVPDVGNVLNAFDVLMLASHREAFSLSLIEAWLCGVPVIATPVGSVPELERKFGRLTFRVPLNPTARDLRLSIELSKRAVVRSRIVNRARRVAEAHLTIQAMAERWMDYLEKVVAGKVVV